MPAQSRVGKIQNAINTLNKNGHTLNGDPQFVSLYIQIGRKIHRYQFRSPLSINLCFFQYQEKLSCQLISLTPFPPPRFISGISIQIGKFAIGCYHRDPNKSDRPFCTNSKYSFLVVSWRRKIRLLKNLKRKWNRNKL